MHNFGLIRFKYFDDMKRLVTLFSTFLLSFQFAYSQNLVKQFYLEQNGAITDYVQTRDTAKIVKFYVQCISKYDRVMLNDIDFDRGDGLMLAATIRDYKSADVLFKFKLSTGLVDAMLPYMQKKAPYTDYFATKNAKQIISDYSKYEKIYKQGIDLAWNSTISSYSNMDQFSRTLLGNNYSWVTGNAYKRFSYIEDSLKKKIMWAMVDVTDSLTFAAIYNAVNEYGFFTRSKTRGGLGVLLVHIYGPGREQIHQGISSTQFLDSVMLKAVKEGDFSQSEYIFYHDVPEYPYRFSTISTYGCSVQGKDGYYIPNEIFDIKNVDKRRAEIHLPPLWVDALYYGFELPDGYVKP